MNNKKEGNQLVKSVEEVPSGTNLSPELLELELTETILIKNSDEALFTMKKLKDLGVRISCDDFGSGYSSLSYLKKFPMDTLKIDRFFIKDIVSSPVDLAIVSSVITMAKNLSIEVVAEGVETKEQLLILQDLGCDIIQGYCFSRALPPADITLILKNEF